MLLREELRFVYLVNGVQSVTTFGVYKMQLLSVDN